MFTSLLDSQRGVFNRLRHFYKAREVFCIVYVTFVKQERFLYCLRHFYKARDVCCIVYVTFR